MQYRFTAALWRHTGAAAWHFITLPKPQSDAIRALFAADARAWGSLPVRAAIGGVRWQTSLFPDRKAGAYLLPVKAAVRRQAGIGDGDSVPVTLDLRP
ncbi:DUF1905 domain-containing protein [Ferrovibrio sp.]|uniref:DUF1905 domain-containing protein n=1 Tax=Ferrovibrio sp. TaxID=1917215 RepID=UPI00311FC6B3